MSEHVIANITDMMVVAGGMLGVFLVVYGIDAILPGHPIRTWLDLPTFSRPEPKYQVRLFDDKGIPIRTHSMCARRMAELIRHIDEGWYT